jgi:hypothetical protein
VGKVGRKVGKKATKATVKHSARGVTSKAKRQPLRSVSLLSLGGAVGATIGWFAGRKTTSA